MSAIQLPSGLDAALKEFADIVGSDAVLTAPDDVREYADPYSPRAWPDTAPPAVIRPASVDEVQAIVRIAARHDVRIWVTPADWRWIIDVNLWGVINGISTFLPLLRANPNGGHIVNTASMAGLTPVPGLGAYSVTKFGVVALSETLAMELEGEPIGVTVLLPGPTRSNIDTSTRNRPEELKGALSDGELRVPGLEPRWLEIDDVGRIVVDAIRQGHLYAITHPELLPAVQQRHDRIVEAFRRLGVSP